MRTRSSGSHHPGSALACKGIVSLRAGWHAQLFRSGIRKRHHEQILDAICSIKASIALCTELARRNVTGIFSALQRHL